MKAKLIALWKNVVKVVFDAFNFYDTILSIMFVLIVTGVSMMIISIMSHFIVDHQWMLLVFDATCVALLTMAIRYRLDRNFQTNKGKWLFWLLFSNVLILIIQSFGALWNFLVMLFLIWPLAIGLSKLRIKETFWWLIDYSGSASFVVCIYCLILAILSNQEILMPGLLSDILMSLAIFLLLLAAVLIIVYSFVWLKDNWKERKEG
jgi:hypothetical protein